MRIWWLVVALVVVGCEKDHARTPQPRPAALVVDYARASSASMDGLKAYLATVKPMLAMAVDESMMLAGPIHRIGMTSIEGLDRTKPLHILVVEEGTTAGIALLAKVGDAKKLDEGKGTATIEKADGWAVIGQADIVKQVSGYALSTLVAQPVPEKPTATIYLSKLVAHHPEFFEQARKRFASSAAGSAQMAAMMTAYVDGLESVARETRELRVTFDVSAPQAQLDFDFTPEPYSRFAKFIAVQQPSEFALLSRMSEGSPMIVVAGHIAGGPYHQALVEIMTRMYSADASLAKDISSLVDGTTGEIALTADMAGGMHMTQLAGITDDAATATALAHFKQAFSEPHTIDFGNMVATYQADAATSEHAGVPLYGFVMTYSITGNNPASQQVLDRMTANGVQRTRMAAADHLLVMSMSPDEGDMGRLIDAERGGAHLALAPAAVALLDGARARKDSLVMLFDLASLRRLAGVAGATSTAPMLMSLGGSGGHAVMHVIVPSKSLAAVM